MKETTKKITIKIIVNQRIIFSIPRRVWNISPPPPQARPKPTPLAWIRIKIINRTEKLICNKRNILFIGLYYTNFRHILATLSGSCLIRLLFKKSPFCLIIFLSESKSAEITLNGKLP